MGISKERLQDHVRDSYRKVAQYPWGADQQLGNMDRKIGRRISMKLGKKASLKLHMLLHGSRIS